MRAKIAAKTKLLQQGAPFNYRQENAPVDVRIGRTSYRGEDQSRRSGDDSGAFLASFHSRLQALRRNTAAYLWTPTPGMHTELMLRNTQVPLSEIAAAMGFAADFPHRTRLRLQRSRLRSVNAQNFWFQFEGYPYRAVQDRSSGKRLPLTSPAGSSRFQRNGQRCRQILRRPRNLSMTCLNRRNLAAHLQWRLAQSTNGRDLVRFHSVENNLHACNCVTGHQACLAAISWKASCILAGKRSDVHRS